MVSCLGLPGLQPLQGVTVRVWPESQASPYSLGSPSSIERPDSCAHLFPPLFLEGTTSVPSCRVLSMFQKA